VTSEKIGYHTDICQIIKYAVKTKTVTIENANPFFTKGLKHIPI